MTPAWQDFAFGTFYAEAYCDRVLWAYRDGSGAVHTGLALDLDGAEFAANLYGYKRNAPAAA